MSFMNFCIAAKNEGDSVAPLNNIFNAFLCSTDTPLHELKKPSRIYFR